MTPPASLIEHIRHHKPATWSLLKLAAAQGFACINDSGDVVLVSEDLRRQHPRLHFLLHRMMEDWEALPREVFQYVPPNQVPLASFTAESF